MKKILVGLLVLSSLSACATKQYGRVQGLSVAERQHYTCREAVLELDKVAQFEKQINETGEFSAGTVFGFLGDFGIGNGMAKKDARKSAKLRRADLEDIIVDKKCNTTLSSAE